MQLCAWHCLGLEDKGPKSLKLQNLCEYFGVPFHAAKAHDAMGDVLATAERFRSLSRNMHSEEIAAYGFCWQMFL